jgi:ribosome biogenesis ATPase
MERRIAAQFLTCMDGMVLSEDICPDALNPALRRAGRFDHEIGMTVPDDEARAPCVPNSLLVSKKFTSMA